MGPLYFEWYVVCTGAVQLRNQVTQDLQLCKKYCCNQVQAVTPNSKNTHCLVAFRHLAVEFGFQSPEVKAFSFNLKGS